MSNRPAKKNKVVEITQDDFDVEWTPPPRTARDRLIQFGVVFLIIAFLLPAITCAVTPSAPVADPAQQAQQNDEVELSIKRFSEELAKNPKDPVTLANLGFYTNQKAARIMTEDPNDTERMTLLVNAEKYLKDALAEDPDYAFAQAELAKNLVLQDKLDEAETLINGALEKVEANLDAEDEKEANEAKSQKVQLILLSAELDRRSGDSQAALAKMNQVIELKPGEPQLYLARAEIHKAAGNKDAARQDLSTVVDIGQKMGNQQMVMVGQMMIEQLDNPQQFEVVPEGEATGSPAPVGTPVSQATPVAPASPAPVPTTPAATATP